MNIVINAISEYTLRSCLTRLNLSFALFKQYGNKIPKVKITVVDSGRPDFTKNLAKACSEYMPIQYVYMPTEGYIDAHCLLSFFKDILLKEKILYIESNVFLSEKIIENTVGIKKPCCSKIYENNIDDLFEMKFDQVEFDDLPKTNELIGKQKLFLINYEDIDAFAECSLPMEYGDRIKGILKTHIEYLELDLNEKPDHYIEDFTK